MGGINEVTAHMLARIKATELVLEPFPYMYITDLFPADYYVSLLKELPDDDDYTKYHAPYESRLYIDLKPGTAIDQNAFWKNLISLLGSRDLLEGMADKFGDAVSEVYKDKRSYIEPHRAGKEVRIGNRILLTRDYANYSISPHTDAPPKFITALFYLAKDESMTNFGTSIYAPKEFGFEQWGADRFEDAHLPFENFTLLETVPYRPNAALVFLKTSNSFHGVEPCSDYSNSGRNMIMWIPEVGLNQRSWGSNTLPLNRFYGNEKGLLSTLKKLFA